MKNRIAIEELAEAVAVPREAYEKAEKRYKSLGEWFDSDQAESAKYSPHIYPQGSFRLQTAIRPLTEDGDYDLDLGSRLRTGITKGSMSQKDLKELIGRDLETYRNSKGIKAPLEAKHRCWRLQYADDMSFHMDIVPSIPVTENRRGLLKEAMHFSKTETALAEKVAQLAGNITDDTKASYPVISNDWLISNSEGYALWFEEMSEHPLASVQKEARAQVDALPKRRRVTALHKSVMLLKAHRDQLFSDNPEAKPVSVIITTLAARAFDGETDLTDALFGILSRMETFVSDTLPRVHNPVNPVEDFADKWPKPEYAHLDLEENFWYWLESAKKHFNTLYGTDDPVLFEKTASENFGRKLPGGKKILEENAYTLSELRKKSALVGNGAKTSAAGVIGSVGVTNKTHGFYGD